MHIVGHCPQCGSPIYGRSVTHELPPVPVRRTCACVPVQFTPPGPFNPWPTYVPGTTGYPLAPGPTVIC